MAQEAHTPFIHHDEWFRINSSTWDYDPGTGGFQEQGGDLYHFYLHLPPEGHTLKLWNGVVAPGQTPVPDPDPPDSFFMPHEEWNKIKGGRLMDNRNWIVVDTGHRTADLFEVVSVQIDDVRYIMAVKIG